MTPANRDFNSVLWANEPRELRTTEPESFRDLQLGRVVHSLLSKYESYDLAPFFFTPVDNLADIAYRQGVNHDLERLPALRQALGTFAAHMRTMRLRDPKFYSSDSEIGRQRTLLSSIEAYADAVESLSRALAEFDLTAEGLISFRRFLLEYERSAPCRRLCTGARQLATDLGNIRTALLIRDGSVTVRQYAAEADYSAEIEATFEKFRHGPEKEFRAELKQAPSMNHIEAQVLERVALLNPDIFARLREFTTANSRFAHPTLVRFDQEIHFYVAYLDFVHVARERGIPFCSPVVSERKQESVKGARDVALAETLVGENKRTVVGNDFRFDGDERLLVVTGPNQGGKSTFARTFGQLHYLASLGCAVPAEEATLFLPDRVFTQFERQEDIATLRGKLEDELVRIREVLKQSTSRSIIVLNEIFSSTTADDALDLSREILSRISELDALCVCVTFLDELTTFNEKAVSMVAEVDPADPSRRTFKIARRPADGRAYTAALAQKHGVTYAQIRERLRQ